jgi:UDP-N-acetylglucosamine 1-carboxyvinyltransferase
MGAQIEEGDDYVTVTSDGRLKSVNIMTLPYPGFPTDMQPQFGALLSLSEGRGEIVETVIDKRFQYTDELRKMGANVTPDGRTAVFTGTEKLHGAKVKAHDLRAGAALVIAGLCADGETEISGADYIHRGYFDLVPILKRLGADISEDSYATHIYGD